MIDRVQLNAGKRSVLVVDDDHFIREIGCLAVRLIGFEAREASSLTEAVNVLTSGRISLVISDVQMPGGSGVELLIKSAVESEGCCVMNWDFSPGRINDVYYFRLVAFGSWPFLHFQLIADSWHSNQFESLRLYDFNFAPMQPDACFDV